MNIVLYLSKAFKYLNQNLDLLLVYSLIASLSFLPDVYKFLTDIKWELNPLSLTAIILNTTSSFILALLSFTSIFFSIENKGLFSSIKNSLIYSIHNFKIVLLIFIIGLLSQYTGAVIRPFG